ncbi:ABC transporter substrate-binding protein [Tessaracoccus caeni]|uniref:ABC transporter substrate-binding protein n=1 Tax=Tessaracoccus caeni TaxID=3031239 RepID=UPI0023DB69EC|nr:ABC transporter substrate-binding protein [Tessaracoccus caeni]MDF1487011.1 ABC transporter substrate-binding protein [Tessaracoccus caeni]
MRRLYAVGIIAALSLTACGGNAAEPDPGSPTSGGTSSTPAAEEQTDRTFDTSGVAKVDEIAALVPKKIAERGTLLIGASADYAPAEFRAEDLNSYIGYDVDLGRALGNVLGLEAQVEDAEFASLIPAIGSKTDIGISSFTIREDRIAQANMISYINVGSSFAVQTGNPHGFNPDDVCGASIAVQTGTDQETILGELSGECTAAGKDAVEILSYGRQSDATTNVVGGKAAAFYADSPVAGYAAALTGGQLEVVGGVRDSAPQGIVVSKDDQALTEAVQKAMQHLMDDGTWAAILGQWGVEGALTTAELNPSA